MDIKKQLEQLADNFGIVAADEFPNLANRCRELGVNKRDVRFYVLAECFDITSRFWGEDENRGVSRSFLLAINAIWEAHLSGVLDAPEQDEGTQLASSLKEELNSLSSYDPLTFK